MERSRCLYAAALRRRNSLGHGCGSDRYQREKKSADSYVKCKNYDSYEP